MSDPSPFLQRMLEQFYDDMPRLAYADWLAENGDADRATFIRLQCERAQLQNQQGTAEQCAVLAHKERGLLDLHQERWTAALGPLAKRCKVEFDRGMIDQIDIQERIADNDLVWLAGEVFLRSLRFGESDLSDQGLVHLQGLANLQELDLGTCGVTDAGIQVLGNLPCLFSVEWEQTRVTQEGMNRVRHRRTEAFQQLPEHQRYLAARAFVFSCYREAWNGVRQAYMAQSGVRDDQLIYLLALPNLESINLFQCPVTSAGLNTLSALRKLRSLNLDRTHVTSIDALAGLTQLRELNLFNLEGLNDDGARALGHLTSLEELNLTLTGISDVTLQRLQKLTHLRTLEAGGLRGEVTDDGLSGLRGLNELQHLDIADNRHITDAGLAHLANATRMVSLKLNDTAISDAGLVHLRGMKTLESLDVSQSPVMFEILGVPLPSPVTVSGAKDLLRYLPAVTIWVADQIVRNSCPTPTPGLQRHEIDEFFSIEFPTGWQTCRWLDQPGAAIRISIHLREDGYEHRLSYPVSHAPAELRFWRREQPDVTPAQAIKDIVQLCGGTAVRYLEADQRPGFHTNPCRFQQHYGAYLAFAWVVDGRVYRLYCCTAQERFGGWESTFLQIAGSARMRSEPTNP